MRYSAIEGYITQPYDQKSTGAACKPNAHKFRVGIGWDRNFVVTHTDFLSLDPMAQDS